MRNDRSSQVILRHLLQVLGFSLLIGVISTSHARADEVSPISPTALAAAQHDPDVQQAMGLKDQVGHKKKAAALFKSAADRGNPIAQAELGHMMQVGMAAGAELDPVGGTAMIRQSAMQGYALGELRLGQAYRSGTGLSENAGVAADWYALAAAQGLPEAETAYGLALLAGDGVAQDEARGRALITSAVRKGDPSAGNLTVFLSLPDDSPSREQLKNMAELFARPGLF